MTRILLILFLSLFSTNSCQCSFWSWFAGEDEQIQSVDNNYVAPNIEQSENQELEIENICETEDDCELVDSEEIVNYSVQATSHVGGLPNNQSGYTEIGVSDFLRPGSIISGKTRIHGPDPKDDNN